MQGLGQVQGIVRGHELGLERECGLVLVHGQVPAHGLDPVHGHGLVPGQDQAHGLSCYVPVRDLGQERVPGQGPD